MLFKKRYSIKNIRKYVVGIDERVPIITGKKTTYINFDNAASTPPLQPVMDKLNDFSKLYASVHRGTGYKSRLSTYLYDEAHGIVGDFVHSDPKKNCVIFVKNATEGINKLSYRLNLSKKDVVITTLMEHHSNDLPWRDKAEVCYANLLENGRLDLNHLQYLLKQNRGKVRLVAVTGASNVTGFVNDIHRIASLAHDYGALVLIDAAQLAPHRKINMMGTGRSDAIDFLVFSGHKIYAPFGTGVLIGPKSCFKKGTPDYVGGGTIKSVTLSNSFWADLPDKEEAGSPNVIGAIALCESIKILNEIGMPQVKKHEEQLLSYLCQELKKIPQVKFYPSPLNHTIEDRVGVMTFNLENFPDGLLASILAFEGGIGVRNGCFCAHPYVHKLLRLSTHEINKLQQDTLLNKLRYRPGMVRISFGLYNTIEEINQFMTVLKTILPNKEAYFKRYTYNEKLGEYYPENFSPSTIKKHL